VLDFFIIIKDKINELREIALKTLYDVSIDPDYDLESWSGYKKMWIKMYNEYVENKLDRMFFNAPSVVVLVSNDPSGNAEVNGGIAVANMELEMI
jgi:hypothetical protein